MKSCLLRRETNYPITIATRLLVFFFLFLSIATNVQAQTWTEVGAGPAGGGLISYLSFAIDNNETPYIAFQDDTSQHEKATVRKYNGSAWVNVGSAAFSAGAAYHTSLAIDGSGTLYLAYSDPSLGYKAIVMKYNGSSWVAVGPSGGFSAGGVGSVSLAIDGAGTPYVAIGDNTLNNKATVMKYDGTNWVTLGAAGFSDSMATNTQIIIDSTGTPFVAYCDYANSKKATVKKFDGSNWQTIGNAGFSGVLSANMLSFAIDPNSVPYIGYGDQGNGGKTVVMKFDGANWVSLGPTSLSCGFGAIGVDKYGLLYEVGDTIGYYSKFTVNRFDGNAWVSIGTIQGNSTTAPEFWDFSIVTGDSSIFIADGYEFAPSFTYSIYAEVRKQSLYLSVNPLNAVKNKLDVYPNPGNGPFRIYYASPGAEEVHLVLINMLGQTLKTFNTKTNTSIDIDLNMPDGIYFLSASTSNSRDNVKIVVSR